MSTVGYSTLAVIPEVKNLRSQLERQTASDFAAAGRRGGRQFGDAASREAGSALKTGLRGALVPAAGLLAGLGGVRIFSDMIAEAQESVKVGKVSAALIKSTGGAANLSANQVGDLANAMSKYAAVDDEAIQAGENVLLTFKAVRNEIGQGNNIFTRATKASLDLSTVLGGDLKGSALQLGKALQDPTKGITALARAGVSFTASQKEQIKGFVASNDLLSAQKLILGEVERQVGGAAGANATELDRLSVSFKNLEESAGLAAAPALNAFAKVATNQVIPGLESAGGVVSAAAHAFGDLPGPVKASAAAFIALRIASATGVTSTLASGATAAGSAMTGLRIRTLLAADAFSAQRASAGRLSASLAAVRAASAGAGGGLTRGLKGATALVGGPWGAALLGGTAILAHFWGEHEKAKARVEGFTEAIKADSGALKENTRDAVANSLEKDGILKDAQKLGINLQTVTDAALGNKDAMASLQATLQGYKDAASNAAESGAANGQEMQANVIDAQALIGKIQGTSGALADSRAAYKRHADAVGETATDTQRAAAATESYATQLDKAKDAIRGLLDIENKRRNAQLTIRQDRLALVEQLQAAREEAGKGARTLDENKKAGQENKQALFDLASQWNNSAESVKNAKGAFGDFRKQFIDIAVSMGDTRTQAQKLADDILNVPRRLDTEVRTPGMRQALDDLAELRAQLRAIHNFKGEKFVFSVQATKNRKDRDNAFAGGGLLRGPGSGTSDSILMWGSNGEFMQRKAAVDYYGLDYMRRLNNLQVPKFAGGGPVGGGAGGVSTSVLGHEIRGTLAIDRDGIAYIRGVVRSEIDAANRAGRGASDRNRRSGLRP